MTQLYDTQKDVTNNVRIEKDVSFLEGNRTEKMDLYLPSGSDVSTGLPVVLQIHGGGWHQGDKATPREQNIGINLADAGFVCASINYRLAKKTDRFPDRLEQIWPGVLHDCMTGVRFLRANAARYNINPDRVAVLGTSSGGHLAAMLGAVKEGGELDLRTGQYCDISFRVRAVVTLYGVHDFLSFSKTRELNLSESERKLCHLASPVTYLSEGDPPFLIIHGTGDEIVPCDQAQILNKAAIMKGVDSDLHLIQKAVHGFHLEPSEMDLRPLVTGFLNKHLT